jgi:hypothetical protein
MQNEEILKKWYETKELISLLEARRDSYKKAIEKIMNERNINVFSDGKYIVKRSKQKRMKLDKTDLPPGIYEKYSKEIEVDFYTINLKKVTKQEV